MFDKFYHFNYSGDRGSKIISSRASCGLRVSCWSALVQVILCRIVPGTHIGRPVLSVDICPFVAGDKTSCLNKCRYELQHVSAILAHFFNPILCPVNSENLLPKRKKKFSKHFIYYDWREVSADDVDDYGKEDSAIWNDDENEGRNNSNGDYEDGCDVKNKDNNKNYEILLMLTPAGCADNGGRRWRS